LRNSKEGAYLWEADRKNQKAKPPKKRGKKDASKKALPMDGTNKPMRLSDPSSAAAAAGDDLL